MPWLIRAGTGCTSCWCRCSPRWCCRLRWWPRTIRGDSLVSLGTILCGLLLFVFLFSHAALLAGLEPFLLFYALLVTELRDVLAYCFGKLLGPVNWKWLHVPVAARINPRKTWVGSALATLGCAAASAAMAPLMPPLSGGRPSAMFLFWIGFLTGWLGLVGDLATGAIKRDLRSQGHRSSAAGPRGRDRPHQRRDLHRSGDLSPDLARVLPRNAAPMIK